MVSCVRNELPTSERTRASRLTLACLDMVDLDDQRYDEAHNVWSRGCRCGSTKGVLDTEHELEQAAGEGVVAVVCRVVPSVVSGPVSGRYGRGS